MVVKPVGRRKTIVTVLVACGAVVGQLTPQQSVRLHLGALDLLLARLSINTVTLVSAPPTPTTVRRFTYSEHRLHHRQEIHLLRAPPTPVRPSRANLL